MSQDILIVEGEADRGFCKVALQFSKPWPILKSPLLKQ